MPLFLKILAVLLVLVFRDILWLWSFPLAVGLWCKSARIAADRYWATRLWSLDL